MIIIQQRQILAYLVHLTLIKLITTSDVGEKISININIINKYFNQYNQELRK